ncbi:MAG: hypothetical protein KDA22_14440 [Phycisphaerales bacterium]|nr:hypothetical protein [Phycisphaerales bacterium]
MLGALSPMVVVVGLAVLFLLGGKTSLRLDRPADDVAGAWSFVVLAAGTIALVAIGAVRVRRAGRTESRGMVVATVLASVLWIVLFLILAPLVWVGGCLVRG